MFFLQVAHGLPVACVLLAPCACSLHVALALSVDVLSGEDPCNPAERLVKEINDNLRDCAVAIKGRSSEAWTIVPQFSEYNSGYVDGKGD